MFRSSLTRARGGNPFLLSASKNVSASSSVCFRRFEATTTTGTTYSSTTTGPTGTSTSGPGMQEAGSRSNTMMDAIATLVQDHRKVSHLLEQLLATQRYSDVTGMANKELEKKDKARREEGEEDKKQQQKKQDLTHPPHPTSPTGSDTAASDPWSVPSSDTFSSESPAARKGDHQLSHEEKRKTLDQVIRELSIHSHIEEIHMYPVIRGSIKNGDALIDRSLNEHQVVKEVLYDLDQFSSSLSADPASWPAFPFDRIEKLKSNLLQHIKEEEEEIFPQLQKNLPKERLVDLGKTLEDARASVPTRPHPSAPNQPPMMNVTGPMAAAYDKARDALREAQYGQEGK